ncbi:protein-tyrosine-phosphatase [Coemansia erecta]|nr:protein-tyrosine-phosphatase [Coemansia sp. RSA 2618]KAJ2825874.1 protein-tyrosine-phosphatase [Coemansia erecta]
MNTADIIDPLIPPYRFERVQNRLYRGGYPKPRNFRFLRRQRLKTLVSLIPSDRDTQLTDYCRAENIERICIPVDSPNENVTLTDEIVSQCLELMTDASRTPLYIHCLDGSNVTGVVVMCLRKLQLWRIASLQNEYLRFEQDGEIIPEESEFVEAYAGKALVLPNPVVDWLWPGRAIEDARLPFKNGVHPVVPLTRLRARETSEICRAEPLRSMSRSATEPSLSESASASYQRQAESDTRSASQHVDSERLSVEPGELKGAGSQQAGPDLSGGRASLHMSASTSVLPELRRTEQPLNARKSRPQSEIHDVLEPVLAALAADESGAGRRAGVFEPLEHDILSMAGSSSGIARDVASEKVAVERGADEANNQTGEALLKLNDADGKSTTSASDRQCSGTGEIREIALSILVRALAIEGLGM